MSEENDYKKLDLRLVQEYLTTKDVGRTTEYHEETDSTMNDAKRWVEAGGASHGSVVLADFQTNGRGRVEGRKWESKRNLNVLMTVLLDMPLETAFKLPLAVPLAVCRALRSLGFDAWIKWPNDVWICAYKVSGMLIDNPQGNWRSIGIGINVNERFDGAAFDARGLVEFLPTAGATVSRECVLAAVLNNLEQLLDSPLAAILAGYEQFDRLVGNSIVVMPKKREDELRESGLALGFATNGLLHVKIGDEDRTLAAEEVTVRPEHVDKLNDGTGRIVNSPAALVTGAYKNELGSVVRLEARDDGSLLGVYSTAVGNASGEHQLRGSWGATADGSSLVAFSVTWNRDAPLGTPLSTTSWTGTLRLGNPIKIVTTWMLLTQNDESDAWRSTLTNKDTFTKQP